MEKWSTRRTGKGLNMIIFTILSMLVLIAIIIRSFRNEYDVTLYDMLMTFLCSMPFLILWVIIFSKFISKKIIPIEIIHNPQADTVEYIYTKGKRNLFKLADFSYSYFEYKNYNILCINKKMKSRRGHIINKELMSIVGLNYNLCWNKEKLAEIAKYFEEIGVSYYHSKDKMFLTRIIQ